MVFKALHELADFKPPDPPLCPQLHWPFHLRAFTHDSLCLDYSVFTELLFHLITIHTLELRPNSTTFRKKPVTDPRLD